MKELLSYCCPIVVLLFPRGNILGTVAKLIRLGRGTPFVIDVISKLISKVTSLRHLLK